MTAPASFVSGFQRLLFGSQIVERNEGEQPLAAEGALTAEVLDNNVEDMNVDDENLEATSAANSTPPTSETTDNSMPPLLHLLTPQVATNQTGLSTQEIADPPARVLANMETTRTEAFVEGYDSDGEGPPQNLTAQEEDMIEEEEPLGETPVDTPAPAEESEDDEDEENEEEPPDVPVIIPDEILNATKGFTVKIIKEELRIRGVTYSSNYNKPELLERLKQSLHLPVTGKRNVKAPKKGKKPKADDMTQFAPRSYWKVLHPLVETVDEPENPSFTVARAPTVPAEDAEKSQAVLKHNFKETFDRPVFKGTKNIYKKDIDGKVIYEGGKVAYEKVPRQKGGSKQSFLDANKLDVDSHPVEFLEAFMPVRANKCLDKHNQPYISIAQCQQWTTLKAILSNAGTDECYKDYKPFTIKEIQQHLALLIINGLSPSPRIDMKFDREDIANYNHYIDVSMPNGLRRHRHFRAIFSVQDPRKIAPPNRKSCPLFKLLPLINWLNKVGKMSWDLSIDVSVDEQTISFQGRHVDKLRITYKAEGDGFQLDALCDDGFTHSVYFPNEPPPKKYTSKGLSPLHARVLWLFDRIEDEWTRCWMDNLYISAKFAKHCYNHPKHVLIAGVARKNGRKIPLSVLQEEQKDKKDIIKVRGTVKAAILEGDKDMPGLVAVSVYDTKPVHFISAVCQCIEWVLKTKKVWNEAKQSMENLNFLRLNVNDDYNMDMNSTDVSDQLRNNYRFDHWLRNFKWWWSIFLWAFGVLCVNSYVSYTRVQDEAGTPKNKHFSHYQFRLAAARIWMDPRGDILLREWKEMRRSLKETTTNCPTATTEEATIMSPSPARGRRARSQSPNRSPCPTTPSVSSLSASSKSSEKKKSPPLSDNSLSFCGSLQGRLDYFGRKHIPISREKAGKTKEVRCALHRWALGHDKGSRANVMVCDDCNVALCLDCYETFHTQKDLLSQKSELKKRFELETAAREQARKEAAAKRGAKSPGLARKRARSLQSASG